MQCLGCLHNVSIFFLLAVLYCLSCGPIPSDSSFVGAAATTRNGQAGAPFPPDIGYTFIQIVESYGYTCEMHQALTDDGYLLTLFHIPSKVSNKKPPVLLQHGLLDSSYTYVYFSFVPLQFIQTTKHMHTSEKD